MKHNVSDSSPSLVVSEGTVWLVGLHSAGKLSKHAGHLSACKISLKETVTNQGWKLMITSWPERKVTFHHYPASLPLNCYDWVGTADSSISLCVFCSKGILCSFVMLNYSSSSSVSLQLEKGCFVLLVFPKITGIPSSSVCLTSTANAMPQATCMEEVVPSLQDLPEGLTTWMGAVMELKILNCAVFQPPQTITHRSIIKGTIERKSIGI